jgi:predicted DNA-binding protein
MVKVTYTLDDETVARIKTTAARLRKPQSQVVREAVQRYAADSDRLTEEERVEKLRIFDEMIARIPKRSREEVDAELREIRAARRGRGRRHPVD